MRITQHVYWSNSNWWSYNRLHMLFFYSGAWVPLCSKPYTPIILIRLRLRIGPSNWLNLWQQSMHWRFIKVRSSTIEICLSLNTKTKSPALSRWAFWGCKSLTMSYFHTGIRTIIGADAFHCPVRDGKEWYHVAMVIRHNLYKYWQSQYKKFIEQISCILNASLGITTLNIAVSKL